MAHSWKTWTINQMQLKYYKLIKDHGACGCGSEIKSVINQPPHTNNKQQIPFCANKLVKNCKNTVSKNLPSALCLLPMLMYICTWRHV